MRMLIPTQKLILPPSGSPIPTDKPGAQ